MVDFVEGWDDLDELGGDRQDLPLEDQELRITGIAKKKDGSMVMGKGKKNKWWMLIGVENRAGISGGFAVTLTKGNMWHIRTAQKAIGCTSDDLKAAINGCSPIPGNVKALDKDGTPMKDTEGKVVIDKEASKAQDIPHDTFEAIINCMKDSGEYGWASVKPGQNYPDIVWLAQEPAVKQNYANGGVVDTGGI